MRRELEDYVDSLDLDAYLVGGAVRDELLGLDSKDADFLVPDVDTEGLKAKLAQYGRVEDLIVAGPTLSVEYDMRRRDFTVNAIARRLSAGEIVDPLHGREDLERRLLRTVSPTSF